MYKISTIITSINRYELLKGAIKSVQDQSYENWELIIIDYSNNDIERKKIMLYCEDLERNDKRVKFIARKVFTKEEADNCTQYSVAINEAFKRSTGDYITYLCDDDWYLKGHYDRMINTVKKCNARLVYAGLFTVDFGGEVLDTRPAMLKRRCLYFTVDHNCIMHERSVFEEVGGWREDKIVRPWGDAEFFYRMAMRKIDAYPSQKITVVKTYNPQGLNSTPSVDDEIALAEMKQTKEKATKEGKIA